MIIHLHPQRREQAMSLSVAEDVLFIDGQAFDFSPLEDGAVLPREAAGSDLIVADISRASGEIHVHVVFPIGQFAKSAACFPAVLDIRVDGPVELPEPGFEEVADD